MTTTKTAPLTGVDGRLIYIGHLARTARFLKLFSISSLGITLLGVPLIFFIKSGMSTEFRTALASAALITSLSSTGIIHYVLAPYVTQITLPHVSTEAAPEAIEPITEDTQLSIDTLTFFGQPRRTHIRAGELLPSKRVFSSWRSPIGQEFHVQSDVVQTEEMLHLVQMVQARQTQ
ncbi:hypothetical protein SYNPS1DRAFT_25248 [Syncephalis pseudoplumigaleata]|uniref:Uncharacterized protein n=2 Tax=Syncephalis pseudoplumigaleata TaxID=1712513 RepID=A0A4V1J0V1_9FUNG|nr:hypothetical protein SYNPS1DRAFT_25248 [Syncephalis pseudoplumigaleata]|eukprot:RKP22839.1 hypothetical protein SYNPS1DRAFT_25248 [Syncephalis pseudoplumigaleata]